MRLSVFNILILATGALSAPVDKRNVGLADDTTIINRSMTNVIDKLTILKNALDTIQRVPPGYDLTSYEQAIERKGQDLTDAMNGGARDVRLGPSAGYAEALGLMGKVSSMQTATDATSKSWVSAKSVIVRTQGGREAALRILTDHSAAAMNFNDALVKQMPGLAQGIARTFGGPALNVVQKTIAAYKKS